MRSEPSRREQKAAATRVGLLEALLRRIDDRPLADIHVRELAKDAGVSQATFFNYFASKDELIVFFIGLWSVEMAARIQALDDTDPLGAIEDFFVATAEASEQNPGVMAEILAAQARGRFGGPVEPPTDADILRAFPDRPELLDVPRNIGLDQLLPPLIGKAIAAGQLPAHTDVGTVMVGVITIFFGASVLRRQVPELPIEQSTRAQLRRLWTALRAEPAPA